MNSTNYIQNYSSLLKRACLVAIVFVTYFFVVRPARQYYTGKVINPRVTKWVSDGNNAKKSEVSVIAKSSKSFRILYTVNGINKETIYSPQFGFFFLIASIGLLCITYRGHYYLFLAGVHLLFEIVAFVGLWIGGEYSATGFLAVDFIVIYLSPVISMGMVPLIIYYKKNTVMLNSPED